MNLGVIFFNNRLAYSIQVLARPVDFEAPGDAVHESLGAFEDFQGAGNAAHGEQCGMGAAKGGIRESQAFPVRESARARNPQRIIWSAAEGNRVGCSLFIEPQA